MYIDRKLAAVLALCSTIAPSVAAPLQESTTASEANLNYKKVAPEEASSIPGTIANIHFRPARPGFVMDGLAPVPKNMQLTKNLDKIGTKNRNKKLRNGEGKISTTATRRDGRSEEQKHDKTPKEKYMIWLKE